MFKVKAYGVTVHVTVKETLNCCGTRQVEQFNVQGNDSKLTEEQVQKILKELHRKVRQAYTHVLVAGDAVGPRGWSAAGGATCRTEKLSLARYCEVNDFKCVDRNVNPNNQHEIRVYISTFNSLDSNDIVTDGVIPVAQDFSDDETKSVTDTDAAKLVQAIRDYLGE